MVFLVGLPRKSGGRVFQRDGFVVTLRGRAGDSLANYQSRSLEVLTQLKLEDEVNHDLLIGDYEDTYYNLTLKMMHSFQWASSSCVPQKPTFVFMDDDFAFNMDKLRQVIANRTESTRGQMAIGDVRRAYPTHRHGRAPEYEKWSFSKREVPWPVLAPHTSGSFYVFGYEIVEEIAAAMYFMAPLPLDDVWLGVIVTKLRITYELLPGLYQYFNPKLHHRKDALFAPFEVLFPIQHDRFGYV
ncbi:unnamed protein product [Schistocephalus solidus]|uniref:Hexosyltransferase n=1 Tax=Schistocephalus solidus TaxID=70667 RepID=A0A183TB81_SCHSO|nr:unnamed protein product [Schistocephalus solidus]